MSWPRIFIYAIAAAQGYSVSSYIARARQQPFVQPAYDSTVSGPDSSSVVWGTNALHNMWFFCVFDDEDSHLYVQRYVAAVYE